MWVISPIKSSSPKKEPFSTSELRLHSNKEASQMNQVTVALFRVDRRPVQPNCYGRGGRDRKLDQRSDAHWTAVLRSNREPRKSLVLGSQVKPDSRVISFEGIRIELHDSQKRKTLVPSPERGFEPKARLRPSLLEPNRQTKLQPVRRCPGGANVSLGPALSDEGESRYSQPCLVEVMGKEQTSARISSRTARLEEQLDVARRPSGRTQGHGSQHGDDQDVDDILHLKLHLILMSNVRGLSA